jgi:hypothetical protein
LAEEADRRSAEAADNSTCTAFMPHFFYAAPLALIGKQTLAAQAPDDPVLS